MLTGKYTGSTIWQSVYTGAETTYYVDATLGNDANDGKTPDNAWQTIAKVNGETFNPGESILLKRGETWRERLSLWRSTGIAGNRIILGAYGTGDYPIINGADILTTWVLEGGTIYSKAGITVEPLIVAYDEVVLTQNDGALATVGPNEWDWAADTLYVNVGEHPDTGTLEASQRNCIQTENNYIEIANIEFRLSQTWGISLGVASSYNYIHNCTGRMLGYQGIGANDGAGDLAIENVIKDNFLERIMGAGIGPGRRCLNWVISGNEIHDANLAQGSEASIKAWGVLSGGHIIEHNTLDATLGGDGGFGIWIDQVPNGCVIRYNWMENHPGGGVAIEKSSDCEIYNNIAFANTNGIYLSGTAAEPVENTHVYHNVFYDNITQIEVRGDGADSIVNNLVKNNICFPLDWRSLRAHFGGENDGVNGSGNVYEYNAFGPEGAGFIEWGAGVTHATYDLWEAVYGNSHSVESNPLMVNPGAQDFHLQVGSPCRGAGATDTGVTDDYDGVARPDSPTQPDIGAYEWI